MEEEEGRPGGMILGWVRHLWRTAGQQYPVGNWSGTISCYSMRYDAGKSREDVKAEQISTTDARNLRKFMLSAQEIFLVGRILKFECKWTGKAKK